MKDALTYRVAIEIQDIIFKTQTVRSGISACTRLRLSLRRLTPVVFCTMWPFSEASLQILHL